MAHVAARWRGEVPRDLAKNLKWRIYVQERAQEDKDFRDGIVQCCREDPIFWINGFGMTYDPRVEPYPKIPFVLYPFQEEAILSIVRAIGDHDILIEKSRDMGASWICMAAVGWMWRFRNEQSFLFVSRVEDYVDKVGNPKALYWKLDYLLDNMPPWLQPRSYDKSKHRSKMHIMNPETGSVIDGESTTGRVARGDRRTAILLDEFAAVESGEAVLSATRDATPCRIFNSTPEGTNNAFYSRRKKMMDQGGDHVLRLHWSTHPEKARGLYTADEDGNLSRVDFGYEHAPGYQFILDGKIRSPWYDNECLRAGSDQEIAQELDIDYLGSGWQFFDPNKIAAYVAKFCRPPICVGDLDYDASTGEPTEYRDDQDGNLRVWHMLDAEMKLPPELKVIVSADISAGTGASNSTIMGYAASTRAKVFEYANPHIRPEGLAIQAVALARWANGAFMIWESNGPGRQFGAKVIELNYGNIYYRKQEEAISAKVSEIPGWASTREAKHALLSAYRNQLETHAAVNYSEISLNETLEYVFTPDGGVVHSASISKRDPSGAKANHGDRVIADALAVKGFGERKFSPKEKTPIIPVGSLAWRNKMRTALEPKKTNKLLPAIWRQ